MQSELVQRQPRGLLGFCDKTHSPSLSENESQQEQESNDVTDEHVSDHESEA